MVSELGRLRLRGPRGAQDEFVLAGIAQNLRRFAALGARPPCTMAPCIALRWSCVTSVRAGRSKPVVNGRMADGHPSPVTDFRNKVCQEPTWGEVPITEIHQRHLGVLVAHPPHPARHRLKGRLLGGEA